MDEEFICEICKILFSRKDNYDRHILNVHVKEKEYKCLKCMKSFGRRDNFNRHKKRYNGTQNEQLPSGSGLKRKSTTKKCDYKIFKKQTAFNEAAVTWKLQFKKCPITNKPDR